jgi:hypothetical protein
MGSAAKLGGMAADSLPPPGGLERFKSKASRDNADDNDGIGDGRLEVENEEGDEDVGFRAHSDAVMDALKAGDSKAFSRALRDAMGSCRED